MEIRWEASRRVIYIATLRGHHPVKSSMNGTPECPAFLPERDFVGYGWDTPTDCWPNGAKIAVNFVVNFEEGGENTLANGDEYSEGHLHEAFHKAPLKDKRDQQLETMASSLDWWICMRS
ncbi:hypothetical protein VKT23_015693 [Stygiomarasmius scandens]|uniref:Uncharacterized protein n=1 Tax=Marasmiellus scandens TaxID=2682957 RepID=A0ABR1IWZ5_9AGAR